MSPPTKATQYIQSLPIKTPTAFDTYATSDSPHAMFNLLKDVCSGRPLYPDEHAFLYEIYYNDPNVGDEQDSEPESDSESESDSEDIQAAPDSEQQSEEAYEKYFKNIFDADQQRIQARLPPSPIVIGNRFDCLSDMALN